jgi:DNA-binding NtrC family response regulator
MSDDRITEAKLPAAPVALPAQRPGYALLVLGTDTATLFTVPETGEATVGRSEECDIHLRDPRLSRVHLIVRCRDGALEVEDNGSRNGTVVGGESLRSGVPRAVQIGDEISIGGVQLVVQYSVGRSKHHRVLAHGVFELRLASECARAGAHGGTFVVMRVRAHEGSPVGEIEAAIARSMQKDDVLALYAERDYEVLFVGMTPNEARTVADELRAHLATEGLGADVLVASFPADGRSQEALMTALTTPAVVEPEAGDVVRSGALARLEPLVAKVAAGSISVLVLGETGVGKEVLARRLHERSPRAKKPLVCLNCASLSESLLESELFGHEKGAFTGAVTAKTGLLEAASGGTAFLDEIGEMPLTLQAKLLRVIEQREIVRVGAVTPRAIDVRFVSATNRDLEEEIARGRFRGDLYYRLNAFTLVIPPLRERVDEIEPLARHFVRRACRAANRPVLDIGPDALQILLAYDWPGNVRELRNVIERAALLCAGRVITPEHLPLEKMRRVVTYRGAPTPPSHRPGPMRVPGTAWSSELETTVSLKGSGVPTVPPPEPTLPSLPTTAGEIGRSQPYQRVTDDDVERRRILDALEKCAGNQTAAAKLLGIARQTLVTRIEHYNLPRPRKRT